jgi:CRISP-associated protein Cas1
MAIKYLYRQLCRLSTLRAAWTRVEESDGCAGIDSVTISRFADNLDAELLRLSGELAGNEYKPLPLLRFFIAKIDGSQRPLSVPVVRDRVAQSAALILIEPKFEQEFQNCSFAYRKGHSVQQALQQVERLHEAGYVWVVEADITAYFDNVDHSLLFARVAELVPDEKVMELIRHWVAARIYDGHQLTELTKGLPQGSPLSPLLANLYLDTFDDQMVSAGQKLIRFADDFLVLCKTKPRADQALKLTRQVLDGLRLTLNDQKTRVTNFTEGFKYLGASFAGSYYFVPPRRQGHSVTHLDVTLPPPLPILRAPRRSREPFNTAIKDAMMEAFEAVAPTEIPSFFTKPRSAGILPDSGAPAAEESAGIVPIADSSPLDLIGNAPGSDLPPDKPPPPPGEPPLPPPALCTLRTLYVHEHGAVIRCEDEHLRIMKDEVEVLSLPAFKIDQIILFGNSQVTTGAMKFCLRHNIPIIVLNGFGRFFGAIESTGNQNVLLQQKQFERLSDMKFVLQIARQIVAGKISNSRALLQRRQRQSADDHLVKAINELSTIRSRLDRATTLDELRGYEGAASASYFIGFAACLPASFGFQKRTRQPPLDPVNALLSFGYTLLFYNIYAIVRARGLSPYVGMLHALRQGHPALCSDLIEELRAPVVDSLVTGLLNKLIFTPADFYYDAGSAGILPAQADSANPDISAESAIRNSQSEIPPGACYLTDKARRTFVAQFERRLQTVVLHPRAGIRTTWRGCIDLQVGHLIQVLRGEAEDYSPLEIR